MHPTVPTWAVGFGMKEPNEVTMADVKATKQLGQQQVKRWGRRGQGLLSKWPEQLSLTWSPNSISWRHQAVQPPDGQGQALRAHASTCPGGSQGLDT